MKIAELPDGTRVEFPDDATPEEMTQVLNSGVGQSAQPERNIRRDYVDPVVRGLSGTAEFLADVSPFTPMTGGPTGADVQSILQSLGIILPEEEQAQGIAPRALELAGASAVPFGGLMRAGKGVLNTVAPPARNFIQRQLASVAETPVKSAILEALGITGAAVAGESAEQAGAGPGTQMAAELAGGVTAANAPALVTRGVVGTGVSAGKAIAKRLRPTRRASETVQGSTRDPSVAAGKIDPDSPVSPAKQTEEERLIALEQRLLEEADPRVAQLAADASRENIRTATREFTDLGGDVNAPREVIARQSAATVSRAVQRAESAAEDASRALAKLPDDVQTGDISRAAREKMDSALGALNDAEREAWSKVGFDLEGSYANTQSEIDSILSTVGRADRKRAIPQAVLDEIDAATAPDAATTLRDIQALRGQVRGLKAAARMDPEKRFQVRYLSKIEAALLKDMESVRGADKTALAEARATTADLFAKFKKGKVGDVLGLSDDSVLSTEAGDTLQAIFAGRFPEQGISQFLRGTPEARPEAVDFVRRQFLLSAVKDGKVNVNQANSFISKAREKRIFEVFPELENEFIDATSKGQRAATLAKRAEIVEKRGGARADRDTEESLAALFLGKPPGQEASLLLDNATRNPVQRARQIVSRFRGNEAAQQGFKSSFAEVLVDKASKGKIDPKTGESITNGAVLSRLINDNEEVLKAAGFTDPELQRMKQAANIIRLEQQKPAASVQQVMTDPLGRLYNIIGRVTGANLSPLIAGKGAGPGLQAAGIASRTGQDLAAFVMKDKGKQIIIDSLKPGNGELLKALLLRNNASESQRRRAYGVIRAYIAGVASEDRQEPEEE